MTTKTSPAKKLEPTPIKAPLNIKQRISHVMRNVEYLQKDGVVRIKTKSGQTFEYAAVTHDAVTAAIRGAVVEAGIIPVVNVTHHEFVPENAMTIIELRLALKATDLDEEVVYSMWAYGQDFGDKGPGKALSLGVKNLYLKAFMLETGESDESRTVVSSAGPINADQYKELQDLMDQTGTDESDFLNYINTTKNMELSALTQLPKNLFPLATSKLSMKKRKLEERVEETASEASENE